LAIGDRVGTGLTISGRIFLEPHFRRRLTEDPRQNRQIDDADRQPTETTSRKGILNLVTLYDRPIMKLIENVLKSPQRVIR
jgi:hypothetical protein